MSCSQGHGAVGREPRRGGVSGLTHIPSRGPKPLTPALWSQQQPLSGSLLSEVAHPRVMQQVGGGLGLTLRFLRTHTLSSNHAVTLGDSSSAASHVASGKSPQLTGIKVPSVNYTWPPGATPTAAAHPAPPIPGLAQSQQHPWKAGLHEAGASVPIHVPQDAKHSFLGTAAHPDPRSSPGSAVVGPTRGPGAPGSERLAGVPTATLPRAPEGLRSRAPTALPTPGRLRQKPLSGAIFAATQRPPGAVWLGLREGQDHPPSGRVGDGRGLQGPASGSRAHSLKAMPGAAEAGVGNLRPCISGGH